ncbi:hypothetical protein Pfo_016741 [Paulownia fortunei]|nr:hypothetical protein Pfo_016741 [Paulownia fortunei]
MIFLAAAGPKSTAHCFVSTTISGSSSGASGIGSIPTPLRLQLHPLKSSVNNVKLSIFSESFYNRKTIITRFQHLVPSAIAKTTSPDVPPSWNPSADKRLAVVAWSAITLVLTVSNRVLLKLALVPMKDYPFFLAQINSFVYVAVYFTVLRVRYRAGITTDEMLAIPKSPFIVIGFLESIAIISGMYAGAMLPGPAIPLLSQTFLVWQLVFSSLLFGRRYSLNQILGCFLVAAGVIVAVTRKLSQLIYKGSFLFLHDEENENLDSIEFNYPGPWKITTQLYMLVICTYISLYLNCLFNHALLFLAGSGANNSRMLSGVGLLWPALMIASSAFQAGASIVKESIFLDAATRLKGKSVDTFVVNAFGSGFQAIFILLFLPILSNLKGIQLSELPSYFKSGAACFLNIGTNTTGCDGAPLLPLLYIISNLLFNISILNLLKFSDAIVASLAVRSAVPISMYVLSLPLPYLPKGVSLSPFFHLGSVILVLGLILYNLPSPRKQE